MELDLKQKKTLNKYNAAALVLHLSILIFSFIYKEEKIKKEDDPDFFKIQLLQD